MMKIMFCLNVVVIVLYVPIILNDLLQFIKWIYKKLICANFKNIYSAGVTEKMKGYIYLFFFNSYSTYLLLL